MQREPNFISTSPGLLVFCIVADVKISGVGGKQTKNAKMPKDNHAINAAADQLLYRSFAKKAYFWTYSQTAGFSPGGSNSSTRDSSSPTNSAKNRRSERSW